MRRQAVAATFLITLAACSTGGFGAPDNPEGKFAPPTTGAPAEDGLTIGNRMMAAGQYELALSEFRRAAFDTELNAETLAAMGTANLGLGRLGQSEALLKRASKLDTTNPAILNNLGIVLMEREKLPEAVAVLRQAFALDSGRTPAIRDNLALALAKSNEPGYDLPEEERYKVLRRGSSEFVITEFP